MKCAQRWMRFWENMEIQRNYLKEEWPEIRFKSKHPVCNSIEYTHRDDNEYFIIFANDTQDSSVIMLSLIWILPHR